MCIAKEKQQNKKKTKKKILAMDQNYFPYRIVHEKNI